MRKRRTPSTLNCGIARALDVVGDAWTMLILRDVFNGVVRFDALQKSLGVASNVLASRLRNLEERGILERHEFREVPPRVEYAPTAKGAELYPVLLTLKQWGDRWELPRGRVAPYQYVHVSCGHPAGPMLVCEHCATPVSAENLKREPVPR